jgi:iron complex transport system permease protein
VNRLRVLRVFLGFALTLAVTFVASIAIGSTRLPLPRVVEILSGGSIDSNPESVVVWSVRMPRALTAMLAGAALGVSGLQMQTLFRNPLADPFVLGISAGASLGVALVVLGTGAGLAAGFGQSLGLSGDAAITAAAVAGAVGVLALVMSISARLPHPATVLVLGVMCGYAVSAFVTILVAASQPERLQQWAQWGFGSFSGVTWQRLHLFASLTLTGLAIAGSTTKQLNALLLGEHSARSIGLAVQRTRVTTMAGASLLGAAVTAFCGPVAFLGIAVPHVCRGLLGTSDHRVLLPAVILMGGIAALVAQTLSVAAGGGRVLPLNAVTALLGAPVVISVLLRSRGGADAP